MQVNRLLWRAYISGGEELKPAIEADYKTASAFIGSGNMTGFSLFHYDGNLFLYFEKTGNVMHPDEFLKNISRHLRKWPGEKIERRWVPLIDVFHFSSPLNSYHWERKAPAVRRIGKIGRLKPEMASRYIFYHYALQEEKAFPGDKYEIIGLNENYLFGYFEEPVVIDEQNTRRGLNTNVVPADWSEAGIPGCFIPWSENKNDRFREMDKIMSIWRNNGTIYK